MKLLLINDHGLSGGGTENRARLLTEEFLKKGYFQAVHVLQLDSVKPLYKNERVFYHYSPGGLRETYAITKAILGEERIDIIQAHNMLGLTPSGIRAAHNSGLPVAWFAHDYWPLCAQRSFIDPHKARQRQLCQKAAPFKCVKCSGMKRFLMLGLFRQMLNRDIDIAIAACNFVKDKYESGGLLRGRWQVINPWIDVDTFLSKEEADRENSIIFTGSLLDYKGAWVLAEAFRYVVKEIPEVKLKFIGGQQEPGNIHRSKLEQKFNQDGGQAQVEFLGPRDWHCLSSLYKRSGVYVCPTVCMESFGLNWAEAMAAGCPVVASRIGSLEDFLEGRAMLVPPRDPARLAQAIITILQNKAAARKLSEKGRDYISRNFRVAPVAEEVFSLYKERIKGT